MLLALYAAPFIWQLLGILTIILFNSPIQEGKVFLYFHDTLYAIGLALLIEKLRQVFQERKLIQPYQFPLAALGIWILAVGLIFGNFHDRKHIQLVHSRAVMNPNAQELVEVIQQRDPHLLTLHSGIMELYVNTPLNSVLYFNQHASHPAAHYSERKLWLEDLARVQDSQALIKQLQTSPYGPIERFVFFHQPENEHYMVYLHTDGYPNGINEESIAFNKALFDSTEFAIILENERYIVLELSASSR